MEHPALSERYREVLKAVIQDYIATAEPVGSRTISRKYGFSMSPATIRNVTADLEEMGYLAQPHTSAGRVPTDRGYRFYVDTLMEPRQLTRAEAQRIEQRFAPSSGEVEALIREAGRVLSMFSHYVAVALAPKLEAKTLRRVEFIPLHKERILAVLVADPGLVQHRVLTLDEVIAPEELEAITRYLNALLGGMTLAQIRDYLVAKMAEEKALYDRMMERALRVGVQAFQEEERPEDVYVGGAANIAREPEFADVGKMQAIFSAFEEKSKLVKILNACLTPQQTTIIIGSEGPVRELQDLSLIASPYRSGGGVLGVLGVVGPTRMPYARVVSLVDYTAKVVSRFLSGPEA